MNFEDINKLKPSDFKSKKGFTRQQIQETSPTDMNTNKNAYHSIFEDCLYLIQDGYVMHLDHAIYAKAHSADEKTQKLCAAIMTFSASEYQAIKYMQYLLENRPIEPGFRSKKLDSIVKI